MERRKELTGVRPPPPSEAPGKRSKRRGRGSKAVLVDNIPGKWRSRDLRNHFSSWLEAEAFRMFHYRHRPSRRPAEKGVLPAYPKRRWGSAPRAPCCCVAIICSDWAEALIEAFDRKPWISAAGDELATLCYISLVSMPGEDKANGSTGGEGKGEGEGRRFLSKKERREQALRRAVEMGEFELAKSNGELTPPPDIPQGFVGTPSRRLLALSSSLPAGLLKRLGVEEGLERRQYAWLYETHPVDNDDKYEKARAVLSREDVEEQEEWDRHLSVDPILDKGRLLGKVDDETLFEEKVDNPWDKHGAEGLVLYTDAMKWDAKKGDFDERTTDAWDVEGTLCENEQHNENNESYVIQIGKAVRLQKKHVIIKDFNDGFPPSDYKPLSVYDRKKFEEDRGPLVLTKEQAMGSFRLP